MQVEKLRAFDDALPETEESEPLGLLRPVSAHPKPAQIVEMPLVGGSSLALGAVPFLFELGGGHGFREGFAPGSFRRR